MRNQLQFQDDNIRFYIISAKDCTLSSRTYLNSMPSVSQRVKIRSRQCAIWLDKKNL